MNAVLAEVSRCERCADAGTVWSTTFKRRFPCPGCSGVYGLPYNPDALRRLARQERKRLKAKVAIVVLETIAAETSAFRKLPPELITTDRVLDRWCAFGTGRPAENPDVYHASLPPPLDPETQLLVSDLVRGSPSRPRGVTYELYPNGAPFSWVAKKYRMEPRAFGRYWHDVLRMHKENFLASKYADLVSLIVAQP